MNYYKKRREKKIIVDFLIHLNNPKVPYPYWYLPVHQNKINWIEWLIDYYGRRTASSSKELLEAYLNPIKKVNVIVDGLTHSEAYVVELETVKFLYH